MKNFYLFLIFLGSISHAQLKIGNGEITSKSALIEFEYTENNSRGIILPSVQDVELITNASNGTFVFDLKDQIIKAKINDQWINISEQGDASQVLPNLMNETTDAGVVIGDDTLAEDLDGALILSSTHSALVLPHINKPHLTVKSPYPGMMCYDTATSTIAIYDGANWNYWR